MKGAMDWTGGALTGVGLTVDSGGRLVVGGDGSKVLNGTLIQNDGTLRWEGLGTWQLPSSSWSIIVNGAGGEFAIAAIILLANEWNSALPQTAFCLERQQGFLRRNRLS